jgi:HlyD family secretion protein
MPVEFTIDTFPGDVFVGTVKKIRLNATMSQNVVTYIVEVVTDNVNGKLIPYLTANVRFIRDRRTNVPIVPNSALRFRPEPEYIVPEFRDQTFDRSQRVLWVADGKLLRPVKVKTGLNAGVMVELLESPLQPGDEIVFGITEVSEDKEMTAGPAKSPFMPTPERKGVRGGGSAANRARAAQAGK